MFPTKNTRVLKEKVKNGDQIYNITLRNCVTTARQILKAGGIPFLDDVSMPKGVAAKINGNPEYINVDQKFINYAQSLLYVFIGLLTILVFLIIFLTKKVIKAFKRKLNDSTTEQVIKNICI